MRRQRKVASTCIQANRKDLSFCNGFHWLVGESALAVHQRNAVEVCLDRRKKARKA
jgi:hypothetical protein